ncbi:hypothetical protein WQ54_07340 [Bacillus sp. SA1-12]|uniref:hypothetical protein n=1 Tax=Bacillus sp. SA1-12 TaxID=1455638 RepID=UPI000624FDB2|nr:hypothetical protein [Bacillus sp. SA1-12]KKI92701.1 hypothetical protein WQ54_07340 [Bacillus sp. SA1-12]
MKVLWIFLLLMSLIHLIDFIFQLLIGMNANTAIETIVNHYGMMSIAEYIILICLLLIFLLSVIYSFYKKTS